VAVHVAVLGYPVGHSRSPAMHNAAFRELGLDWRYEAIEVEPERFEALVRELPGRGFAGANVTVPHKLRALAAADSSSAVARAVGAANTLVFAGEISADNTDVEGFTRALRDRAPGAPAGMRALVLGAGGSARAVVYGLLRQGAARVDVWNRHPERALSLVEELSAHAATGQLRMVPEPSAGEADLLVNTTSVGMVVDKPSPRAADDFKQLHISADNWGDVQLVVDLVYRDEDTPLIKQAEAQGITHVDGFDILVHQGAASFEIWTGKEAPLEAMRRGARRRENYGDA
jgi:shikimate dehydrogenase